MIKRFFDIFFSLLGLTILFPLFIIVAIVVKLDSKGPVFFLQERVGRNFSDFKIYKFRSMYDDTTEDSPEITVSGDKRVTRVGKILRKYKIDELPQLVNVLIGDMSFVGPRPEVRKYVAMFKEDYSKLLTIRPGITDPASIEYSDEENVLLSSVNWEEDYIKKVLPDKIKLSFQYVDKKTTICDDVKIIMKTFIKVK